MVLAATDESSSGYPLVSIGMPVRNGESTVAIAVRSVLFQTYTNWELLLIDDGSTDQTSEIVREFCDERIRVVSHKQSLGLAARLNEAVAMAKGRYFARMDGDDVCFPTRLAEQVAYLEARPEVDLLGCGAVVFDDEGQLQGSLPQRLIHQDICATPWAGFYLPHPTWMGRVEWFRANPYDNRAVRAQDQDLLLRTYRHSHFAALPDMRLGYRQDSASLARVVRGRLHFGRALLLQVMRGKDWGLIRGVFLLFGKLLADVLSITFGCYSKRLRRRTELVTSEVRHEWESLWPSLRSSKNDAAIVARTLKVGRG